MDRSESYLIKRADGWVETPDGSFAIKMMREGTIISGSDPEIRAARYSPSPSSEIIRIEWLAADTLSVFPDDVASSVVRLVMARQPTDAEILAYNTKFADDVRAAMAEHHPKPAKSRVRPPKGENAKTEPDDQAGDDLINPQEA